MLSITANCPSPRTAPALCIPSNMILGYICGAPLFLPEFLCATSTGPSYHEERLQIFRIAPRSTSRRFESDHSSAVDDHQITGLTDSVRLSWSPNETPQLPLCLSRPVGRARRLGWDTSVRSAGYQAWPPQVPHLPGAAIRSFPSSQRPNSQMKSGRQALGCLVFTPSSFFLHQALLAQPQ